MQDLLPQAKLLLVEAMVARGKAAGAFPLGSIGPPVQPERRLEPVRGPFEVELLFRRPDKNRMGDLDNPSSRSWTGCSASS